MSRLSGLRRGAAKAGGGRGKGKGGYYAKWTPPGMDGEKGLSKSMTQEQTRSLLQASEPIILVPGDYADPFNLHPTTQQPTVGEMYAHRSHRYQRHYRGQAKGFRSMACTRGPDQHAPQPCVPCLLIDQKEMDEKGSAIRTSWVVNLLHLSTYFESQYIKDGQPQTRDGSPVMVKRECKRSTISNRIYWEGRAREDNKTSYLCDGCTPQGCAHPLSLGNQRYWELGKGHLDALLDFNDKVLGNICYYTGTGIVKKGFNCGACRGGMIDIAQSQLTNDQIKQYEDVPQACPHCGVVDLPIPDYESGFDEHSMSKIDGYKLPVDPTTGHPVPVRPLDIFDVVMWVQREGESTKSVPVFKHWTRITEAPFGEGGAAMDLTDMVKELVPKVFDFAELFSTTADAQAKELDRPNPYAAQQQHHGYTPAPAGHSPTIPPPAPPNPGYAPPAQAHPTTAPGTPAGYAPPAAAAPVYPPPAPPAPGHASQPPAPPVSAAPPVAAVPPTHAPPPLAPVATPPVAPVAAPPITAAPPAAAPGGYAPPPASPGGYAPPPAPTAAPPTVPAISTPYPQPQTGVPVAAPPIAPGPPTPGNRPDYGGNQ